MKVKVIIDYPIDAEFLVESSDCHSLGTRTNALRTFLISVADVIDNHVPEDFIVEEVKKATWGEYWFAGS